MALSEGQFQIRDLVMGPGTGFRLMSETNPFNRTVRAEASDNRAWGHGSTSGVEWMEQAQIPLHILVEGGSSSEDWMKAHQRLARAFRPIGESIEPVELRFRIGEREYVLFGRPRMVEPDLTLIGMGVSITQAAFVALDPFIYSAEEQVYSSIGLPTFTGGLTVPGSMVHPPEPETLNPNPDFEEDASGWSAVGASIERSTDESYVGDASGLVIPDDQETLNGNPTFETDASGWSAWSATISSQETSRALTGDRSGLLSPGSSEAAGAYTGVSVSGGSRYTWDVWLYPMDEGPARLEIAWADSSGNVLGRAVSPNFEPPSSRWSRWIYSADAHEDAIWADAHVVRVGGADLWIDEAHFFEELGPDVYVSTDAEVSAGSTYQWSMRLLSEYSSDSDRLEISWRDSEGEEFDSLRTGPLTSPPGEWARHSLRAPAPSGAASAQLRIRRDADHTFYVDDAHFTEEVPRENGGGFTVPLTVDAEQSEGMVELTNEGTADADLTMRLHGPVPQPVISLRTEDGDNKILRIDMDLSNGQWLDIDTSNRMAMLNGEWSRRSRVTGDWPKLPPGTHVLRWSAAEINNEARLGVAHRSVWW